MSLNHVNITRPHLFYIQDSTLLRHGFKLTQFEESVSAGTFRHKIFDLNVGQGKVISVSYTYQSVTNGIWQLAKSRIDIIIDGIEVPTHACSMDELKNLYEYLTGKELKEKLYD